MSERVEVKGYVIVWEGNVMWEEVQGRARSILYVADGHHPATLYPTRGHARTAVSREMRTLPTVHGYSIIPVHGTAETRPARTEGE